jgi:hypothetical protein
MVRRLRSFAVLAGLFVAGVDCGAAEAQTPAVSAADVADTPPAAPARVAPATPAPDAPVPVVLSGARHVAMGHVKTYPYPVATLPGFEILPDGGSRLFVEITRAVNVEERRSERVLTYILKGTRVIYRNNENSLVTVHFNTPVTRARLLPSGGDLLFSVDLRADAAPAWKMVNEGDGTATLQVDFPKGNFLPAGEIDETSYGGARPASAPPPPPDGPGVAKPKSSRKAATRQSPPATPAPAPGNAQPTPN